MELSNSTCGDTAIDTTMLPRGKFNETFNLLRGSIFLYGTWPHGGSTFTANTLSDRANTITFSIVLNESLFFTLPAKRLVILFISYHTQLQRTE